MFKKRIINNILLINIRYFIISLIPMNNIKKFYTFINRIKGVRHFACFLLIVLGASVTQVAKTQSQPVFDINYIHITEFVASNSSGLQDEDGDYPDWIEIYNPTSETISLYLWFLTDNLNNLLKWQFPDVQLLPGSYMIVFLSGKDKRDPAGNLHTNFKLNASGENLALIKPDGANIVFSFPNSYPLQYTDISYGIADGSFRFLRNPSPGLLNYNEEFIPAPEFSVKRGVYENPFSVEMSAAISGGIIRYTTDGSFPSMTNGETYSSPVFISSTTPLRAIVYKGTDRSEIITHTYFFLDDVIHQPDNPAGYPVMWGPYKTLPGNAIADYGMDPEVCNDPLYADSMKKAFLSIPIMSVVTDKNNFFLDTIDDEIGGIYIYTGMDGVEIGRDWERPVSAEYIINGKSDNGFQVNCGIRIQGGEGRVPEKSPKHSFRLVFRSQYGPSKLRYKLFNDESATDEFNTLILRAGFCNTWYHWDGSQRNIAQYIRDPWTKDTQIEMMGIGSHNSYVHLFLNGLYWGLYSISERLDEEFMETYLGGNEEDYDVIKDYTELVSGTLDNWNAMMTLANKGLSDNTSYFKIQGKNPDGTDNPGYPEYLDVDNLIDYMLINIYGGNDDWDHHNWVAARNRISPGSGFQFFCWDAEHVLKNINTSVVNENNDNCPSRLYTKLRDNEEFRVLFADHVYRHFFNDGALTPGRTAERYSNRAQQIKLALICESARWGDYRRDVHSWRYPPYDLYTLNNQWTNEYNRLINQYFPARTQVVLNQLIAEGLYSNVTPPVFSQNGGVVAPDFRLTMSAPAGTIYYTTDGSDPRLIGGDIAPVASEYNIEGVAITDTMVVKARAKEGNVWSPLVQATFYGFTSVNTDKTFTDIINLNHGSYPNPFITSAIIYYTLPRAGNVDVMVYSADGRLIDIVYSGYQAEGMQSLIWAPAAIESGIYYYIIRFGNQKYAGKLVYMK